MPLRRTGAKARRAQVSLSWHCTHAPPPVCRLPSVAARSIFCLRFSSGISLAPFPWRPFRAPPMRKINRRGAHKNLYHNREKKRKKKKRASSCRKEQTDGRAVWSERPLLVDSLSVCVAIPVCLVCCSFLFFPLSPVLGPRTPGQLCRHSLTVEPLLGLYFWSDGVVVIMSSSSSPSQRSSI